MAICKNCGCFTKESMTVCPRCGAPQQEVTPQTASDAAPAQTAAQADAPAHRKAKAAQHTKPKRKLTEEEQAILDWQPVDSPDDAEPPKKKKKKGGAAKVILILLLVVLLGLGGFAGYRYFMDSRKPQYVTFDYSCAEFTAELNRVIAADKSIDVQLDESKWTQSQAKYGFDYDGGSFTLRAKTANTQDMFSKMRELRVGPTGSSDGAKLAALSILTLEPSRQSNAIMRDMADVKGQQKDKVSYRKVAFTYDRDRDEFVLVPSNGNKSPENYGAGGSQSSPDELFGSFVSGDRFIRAGGKYIISDGKSIRYRTKITDSDVKIADVANDCSLLSDGYTIYYVVDTGNGHQVCSVKIDGTDSQMLFEIAENVTLLHARSGWLYYVKDGLTSPDDYTFCKYNIEKKQHQKFKDITFASHRTMIEGDIMYCSRNAVSMTDINEIDAYRFDFSTEKYTKEVGNCLVSPHGYYNGAGNPCLDSHTVSEEDNAFGDHYLYTSVNGKLQKSAEVKANASLLLASPTTDETILFDNSNQEYYWFNRKTGDLKKLALTGLCGFTFDIEHPETIWCCVTKVNDDSINLTKLYQIVGGVPVERFVEGSNITLGMDPVIAGGYLLDNSFTAHAISEGKSEATSPATAAASEAASTEPATMLANASDFLGTWSDEGENVVHTLTITAIEGDHVTFSIGADYLRLDKKVTAENLQGDLAGGKLDFTYTDSSGNTGKGELTLRSGSVHLKAVNNSDGQDVGINVDADMTEHTPAES